MININTIEDLLSKEVQKIFQALSSNLGMNFVAVFDLKNQKISGFVSLSKYYCSR